MHGLPIEMQIEKELPNFNDLTIKEKIKKAEEYAKKQVKTQANQLKKLNLSFRCAPFYLTSWKKNISKEYEIFLTLFKKGLIEQEYKPVAWSIKSQTSLSNFEINYEEVECESIYFKWQITEGLPDWVNEEKVEIILWTTTPYSLEANLAIAFSKKITYCFYKVQNKTYLSSHAFLKRSKKLMNWKNEEIIYLGLVEAEILSKLKYWNSLTGHRGRLYQADFLKENEGSGFVHLAPGLGEDDYLVCKRESILPYCAINEKGFFKDSKFKPINEKFYLDASQEIIKFLKKEDNLLKIEKIKHKVGKCSRDGSQILFRSSKQWFLKLDEMKKMLNEETFNQLKTSPEWLKEKLKEQLNSRFEWCISRQRYWGLPIPIKSSKELQVVEANIEWLNRDVENWWDNDSADTLDVWFDSGSIFNLYRKEKPETFPADLYIEGSDQLRGWFNSSSILSLLTTEKLPFKSLLAHGFVLDEKGNKMSKSKGNVVDPTKIVKKFGTDIFRLWVASSNFLKDIRFSNNQMTSIVSNYRKVRNVLFKFSLSVLKELDWKNINVQENVDCYTNSLLYFSFLKTVCKSKEHLNSFNFNKVIQKLLDFVDRHYSWYLEIVKPILYSREPEDQYKKEILYVISLVVKYSLLIISVFLPQTAEEIYSHIQFKNKKDKKESVWLENFDFDFKLAEKYLDRSEKKGDNERIEMRDKLLPIIKKGCLVYGIGSLKEVKLFIDEEIIEWKNIYGNQVQCDMLKKILGVAEVLEADEIWIEKTSNRPCERCLLYCYENDQLNEKDKLQDFIYEGKVGLLCRYCREALEKQKKKKKS